ncbi:glycosyltransferase family 2 protein [Peribacillus sp. SCS-26]|uniref:glycosyltransferase family 2 protein n=1 Tax=Paraperibacillus marinus TaxID=3115295 RepID=UPI003906A103
MISVVACTYRENFVDNIIFNFRKQTMKEKELILVLNSSSFTLDQDILTGIKAKILQFPDETSLGECLNKGVEAASYDVIAKMDDDDYYGPGYLQESYDALKQTGADMVGKSSFYIFLKKLYELRLYNPAYANCWITEHDHGQKIHFLCGASLVFNKEIFKRVSFPSVNLGEDTFFQKLCAEHHMKVYSLSNESYVYIRYDTSQHHTSNVRDSILRRRSKFVANTYSIADFMEKRERK